MNLKAKLLLVLIPLSVISICAMSGILYWMSHKGLQQTNDNFAAEVLNVKAGEVDEWRRVKMNQLMMFTQNAVFVDACQGRRVEEARQRLKYYFEQDGMLENLFLAQPDGKIFLDAIDGKSVGVQLSSLPEYAPNIQKALQGEGFFGHGTKSPATGKPVILVTAPLKQDGAIIGIIGCPVELETFAETYVNKIKIGKTGYIYIADENGLTVAHPDKQQILALNLNDLDFGSNMLKMKDGKYSYNWAGVDRSAYFKTSAQTGWLVALSLADEETYAASRQLGFYALLIGAIIIALTCVFSTASIVRLVISPMKKIMHAAGAMEKGDLEANVDYTSSDEVGQLADAFRNMQTVLRGKAEVVECIANGDMTRDVVVASDRDTLGKSMTQMVASLKAMNAEVKALIEAAVAGKLDVRADASRQRGDYALIISGFNQTLDAMVAPIHEISDVLSAAAEKDLTRRVSGNYKGEFANFKDNVNATVESLEQALQQVAEAVSQVSSASNQIAIGSQNLAEGASEQASSLEEVSSSLEELASMTRQNADNAKQAQNLAVSARDSANKGGDSMKKMADAIAKIKESSDQTAKIVKTIDEIAFQTNLLALNAAVEAARAGEAGKGFAVVAEEVRSLAQRSAEAAKNTAQMIEGAVKNAEGGVRISDEMAAVLKEIVEHASKVGDLVAEISAAAVEQSQGIDQITTAVSQMDQVTQTNASNSEESASAAEELNSQAEELQAMVGNFRLSNAMSHMPVTHAARGYGFARPKHKEEALKARSEEHVVEAVKRPSLKGKLANGVAEFKESSGNGAKTRRDEKSEKTRTRKPEEVIPLDDGDFKDF